jgi:hypothetical protein
MIYCIMSSYRQNILDSGIICCPHVGMDDSAWTCVGHNDR